MQATQPGEIASVQMADEEDPAKKKSLTAVKLRFCPESNDLLYPRELKREGERPKLVFACRNCEWVVGPHFLVNNLFV